MAIQTRNSVLAIKEETTEGVPAFPTAPSDYLALQPDFAMAPAFETLTNDEIKASIGAAAPILGLEQPTASMSHYLRHSGVKAQAPNYAKTLLKAAFGEEFIAGAEYAVVSSTASTVTLAGGQGANMQRGMAVMIKDPVNGFRIRSIESVAGDVLTLGFNVPVAPGAGVQLGQSVTYLPANEGHPTLTVVHYLGNGGAIQMMSGGRVVDTSITIEAGQLINVAYSIEGNEYFFDPIEVLSTNNRLDFDDGSGEVSATIAARVYKDPTELAEAIQVAMSGLTSDTITVTYSHTTGRFTIASSGSDLDLLWSTGANTANSIALAIGFTTAADSTGALSYTGVNPIELVAADIPVLDSSDPLAAKNHEIMVGDSTDFACFNASSVSVTIGTPKTDVLSVCAVSGKSGSIINERTVTAEVTALLTQFDAKNFAKFRKGQEVKMQYSFGTKAGGNWQEGRSGAIFMPTAKISGYTLEDQDGLVALTLGLTGFVNDQGAGEVYISFV